MEKNIWEKACAGCNDGNWRKVFAAMVKIYAGLRHFRNLLPGRKDRVENREYCK